MENKKTNMTHIWPILLMLVILLAGGVIFYLFSQKAQPVEMEQTVVALTPTSQKPAPSNIAIPGYPELTLISDTGVIPAVFENPEGNPCYFKLDLILSDTGQTIWSSENFKPGTGIQSPTAAFIPESGVYNAELRYTTTSLDDLRPLNTAVTKARLTVQ